ncbi:MAG TPA: TRAP transporter large permease subunit [Marinobacter sp.]|nr:TRAP transporter large permease subunit [Marinobacter sp.]
MADQFMGGIYSGIFTPTEAAMVGVLYSAIVGVFLYRDLDWKIGLDPIQLGARVVINFAVGMVTPPVGYSIFVASSISGLKVETVARHIWPFMLVLLAVVALVAYVPAVTLWLPETFG